MNTTMIILLSLSAFATIGLLAYFGAGFFMLSRMNRDLRTWHDEMMKKNLVVCSKK